MSSPLLFLRGVFFCLGGTLVSAAGGAQGQEPLPDPQYVSHDVVPAILDMGGPDVICRVTPVTFSKRLRFFWRFGVSGSTETYTNYGEMVLAYCPTAVSAFGADKILVAGVTDHDRVQIELIEFHPAGIPSAVPIGLGGQPALPQVSHNVKRRRVIYDAPYNGSNWITGLWQNRGKDGEYWFLEFGDPHLSSSTRQIKARSVSNPNYESVIGMDGPAGITASGQASIPGLDGLLGWSWNGEYSSGGLDRVYVYWLGTFDEDLPSIKLVDQDGDGKLDEVIVCSGADLLRYARVADYLER